MVAISTPAETRTLLENISWQTFKAMLADMGSSRNTRLAYENGTLEILTPFMALLNTDMNSQLLSKLSPLNPPKLGDFKIHFSPSTPRIGGHGGRGWGAIHILNQQCPIYGS